MMNKKAEQVGGEFTIWIYRFLLIGAITFALIILIGNKYTEKFDVRGIEASILSRKMAECLDSKQMLSPESLKPCLGIDEFSYYLNVNITSLESNFQRNFSLGNDDLKVQCELIEKGTRFSKPPLCSAYNYLLLIDDEEMNTEFKIFIGKHDKNLQ